MAVRGLRSWVAARPRSPLAVGLAAAGVPVVGLSPSFEWDPAAVARLRALLRQSHPRCRRPRQKYGSIQHRSAATTMSQHRR
jgi:hypothetical protein